MRLLKAEGLPDPTSDPSSGNLDVTHEIVIPSDDTTYWCSVHRLPGEFRHKHHVTEYEAVATPGNEDLLHHMEVFHCVGDDPREPFPLWAGPCGAETAPPALTRCKKVLAAWAVGAGPFVYPEEAGLAVGGEDFGPYLMLEVHYNNQDRLRGRVDRSGLRLTVTRDLRPHDAGIMELGLIYGDSMAIPPGQKQFTLSGHCVPGCTAEVIRHF